jgi:hypothetical protein
MENVDVSLEELLPLLTSIFCDFMSGLGRGVSGLDGTARSPREDISQTWMFVESLRKILERTCP